MSDSNSVEPTPKATLETSVEPVIDTQNAATISAPLNTSAPAIAATLNASATGGWQVISVKPRVDSFNQDDLIAQMRALKEQGETKIALDLKNNRFLSLPVIKFCVEISKELAGQKGGFALVSCPEKTKRHFEIYGSLKHIRVVRSERDLDAPPQIAY